MSDQPQSSDHPQPDQAAKVNGSAKPEKKRKKATKPSNQDATEAKK